ncbi:MAG: tripartite tricarboxylate transporter TctB family protein [Burkholderiales bacterium]|jgi:putative tricarboxylic transport membrane protein|nr:tripartite tricarboxylate transporter TctB family protein [Burkholderiales bacterium]MDP4909577.1 tripartite tricarboxylate transporter TctB family protein [Burkholderiaceae bacterium]MDP4969160.1 tripartite tricarboxylate transporter TctB family protein [Burkholderiaceae bacterium]
MKRLNRDTVTAVLLLLFCGLLYQQTFFVRKVPFSIMGSEVWPRVILTALCILLLIYLFKSLITPPKNATEKRSLKVWLEMYRNPVLCFGMFFLFLLALPYVGILIGGILFVFITQTLIGSRDKRSLILHALVSVGAVGGMWAVFRFGLGVVMPTGSLF